MGRRASASAPRARDRRPPTPARVRRRPARVLDRDARSASHEEPGTGRLVRAAPRTDRRAGRRRRRARRADRRRRRPRARASIRDTLAAGGRADRSRRPASPSSPSGCTSSSAAATPSTPPSSRRPTATSPRSGQQFVPGDRDRVLLPLAFCRECGQEYYTVGRRKRPRRARTRSSRASSSDVDGRRGPRPRLPLPRHGPALARRPDGELEPRPRRLARGARRTAARGQARPPARTCPRSSTSAPDGVESAGGLRVAFVPAPFRFCLRCGVAYGGRQTRDFGKLGDARLGRPQLARRRLLSLTAIRRLRARRRRSSPSARKLLTFTDNRQDASLQAGHFNDFVEVGLLRSALYRAAAARRRRRPHATTSSPRKVFDALALARRALRRRPGRQVRRQGGQTDAALRDVLGYRLYRDLERGWRVTSPNLEQCGLLEIHYESLDELAAADDEWASTHPALAAATPEQRRRRRQGAARPPAPRAGDQGRLPARGLPGRHQAALQRAPHRCPGRSTRTRSSSTPRSPIRAAARRAAHDYARQRLPLARSAASASTCARPDVLADTGQRLTRRRHAS